jgi:hypothetical protein
MYVVRSLTVPDRYVVAIRGTNPVSGLDWLLGDLWVAKLFPWGYCEAHDSSPAISLSTALGMSVLQHLRSPMPASGSPRAAWQRLDEQVRQIARETSAFVLDALGHAADQIRPIRAEFWHWADDLVRQRLARSGQVESQVAGLLEEWRSDVRQHAFSLVDNALDLARDHASLGLLLVLEDGATMSAQLARGHDLLTFLRGAVALGDSGGIDVTVTGHSKGGALASTLALWLADTQGLVVPAAQQWDPERRARLRCFSFAGPSAGNTDFVRHSNTTIGAQCWRVSNPLDVVPCAWQTDSIRRIPELYGDAVAPIPGLVFLSELIASELESLGYEQPGTLQVLPGVVALGKTSFPEQMIHQHLDGYLQGLGLGQLVNTWSFFNPVA